jgi:hypothetical protein
MASVEEADATTRPYRPSNGTEGEAFMEAWCARCARDAAYQAGEGDSCPIAAATVALAVDDPDYPAEWITGAGGPRCMAFEPVEGGGTIHDARQKAIAL